MQRRKTRTVPGPRRRKRVGAGRLRTINKRGSTGWDNIGGKQVGPRSAPRRVVACTCVLLLLPQLASVQEQLAREERVREVLVHHLGDLRPGRVEDVLPPLRGRLHKVAFVSDLFRRGRGASSTAFKYRKIHSIHTPVGFRHRTPR